MLQLTQTGQQIIDDLAQRYSVSSDAVMTMLQAVIAGNGTMAQFNHTEFGGSGQWMQGGMTMVGDMFNYALKSKVEGLCSELSNLLANQQHSLFLPQATQSQSQGAGQQQQQQGGYGDASLFVPGGASMSNNWWPDGLGVAASSGAQNNIRYAYFPSSRRLAVDINGQVSVYDTLDHQISGVSQQQSGDSSVTFTSQYGLVRVDNLPLVSADGNAPQQQQPPPQPSFQPAPSYPPEQPEMQSTPPIAADEDVDGDIFNKIERLAELREKGIISEDEFSAKKTDLLSKL